MARDDSDAEDSVLSEEENGNHEESSDKEAEVSDDSVDAKPKGRATNERDTSAKLTALAGRPPRPSGRLGIGRLSLGLSSQQPLRPSRPAVSRLRDDGDDEAEEQPTEADLQRRREENIRALVNNSLQTTRQPLMSKFLTVLEGEMTLRKPFQSPVQGAPRMSDALRRKLVARRHFVPWGSSTPLPIPTMSVKPQTPAPPVVPEPPAPEPEPAPTAEPALPEGIEPLVLWQAPPGCAGAAEGSAPGGPGEGEVVVVDNMLVRFLRPHQREGVQFMFECVTGQRLEGRQGCILADDMGLGKTLQGITLLWTLLTSGHPLLGGCPIARRAIIVCPTSLVSNWDNECTKWLQGRLKTLAMCESSREDVVANIGMFLHPSNVYKVLIISYETFRMHAERFQVPHACDLLVCDEAHRLKNDATLTNRALDNLPCKRRVLLSGTPMQNHLDEFFAMVDFCNPGVLGVPAQFRKYYELPILAGREPDAAPEEVTLGEERSRELSGLTNNFILRRTNKLLSQHLPPKVIEVVCCRLTALQQQLYGHFLQSKAARRVLNGRTSGVLSAITSLKKLCNHPKLIYDAVHSKAAAVAAGGEDGEGGGRAEGFEDVGSLFPPGLFDNGRVGRGGMAAGWEAVSGKMAVLARMLHVLYTETSDRIVLVSNYTSTLDLFAQLCRERGYPFVRLDGTTTINKRQKLVKVFNDPAERQFAFLLSSKAGGCGLNLIGANRLVLFDPDWNPANDQQAAARVWRDGQRKRVFVYRFLTTGSIEEKVYQRQLSKEGLKQLVSKNGKAAANVMTAEDLRELFTLNTDSWSDTYDYMCGGPGTAAAAEGPINLAYDIDDDDGDDDEVLAAGKSTRWGRAAAPGGDAAGDGPVPRRLAPVHKKQSGEPAEEDLANWGHHPSPETVPDAVMRRVAAPDVSFIFSCSVAGKPIEGGDEEDRRLADPAAAAAAAATAVVQGARTSTARGGGGGMRRLGGLAATPRLSTPAAAAQPPKPPPSATQTWRAAPVSATTTPTPTATATPGSRGAAQQSASSGTAAAAAATARAVAAAATPLTAVTLRVPSTSPPGTAAAGSGRAAYSPPSTVAATMTATTTAAAPATNHAGPRAGAPPQAPGQLPPPHHAAVAPAAAGGSRTHVSPPETSDAVRTASRQGAAEAAVPPPPPGSTKPPPAPAAVPPPPKPSAPGTHRSAATVAASRSTGSAGSGNSSGGSSRQPSSVTGAVVSGVGALGSGAGGRSTAAGAGPAAAAAGAAGGKPAAPPASASAAVVTGPPKPAGPPPPQQPLRSSAAPNAPQQPRAAAATAPPQPKPTGAGMAAAAAPPHQRQASSTGPRPPGAAAMAGPPGSAPGSALAVAAAAAPKPGAAAVTGSVRPRTAMEGAGGAPLISEAPKPKRQRAPGWYIDSDDEDFR